MEDYCKEKTKLVCLFHTYYFNVMLFGLMNAPSTIQLMMDHVLADMYFSRIYIEVFVIISTNLEEHVEKFSVITSAIDS